MEGIEVIVDYRFSYNYGWIGTECRNALLCLCVLSQRCYEKSRSGKMVGATRVQA